MAGHLILYCEKCKANYYSGSECLCKPEPLPAPPIDPSMLQLALYLDSICKRRVGGGGCGIMAGRGQFGRWIRFTMQDGRTIEIEVTQEELDAFAEDLHRRGRPAFEELT